MKKELNSRFKELQKMFKNKGQLEFFGEQRAPKIKMKTLYNINVVNFEFYLIETILRINMIDIKEYIYGSSMGTICDRFRFNKRFKKLSAFNWSKDALAYPTNTNEFRGKFITLLLFYFLDNSKEIISKSYNISKDSLKKGEAKYGFLNAIINRLNIFTSSFLSSNTDYGTSLLNILDLFAIDENTDSAAVKTNVIRSQKEFFGKASDSENDEYDDDLIWNNLLKVSYLLVTGNDKFKHLPKYVEEKILQHKDVFSNISQLGFAIMKHKVNHKKVPMLYNMYCKSNPTVSTSLIGTVSDSTLEFEIGLKAIHYTLFVLNIDSLDELIYDYL